MTLADRLAQTIEFLTTRGVTLSSSELTESFDVSVQTIRKNLNDLSDLDVVPCVHGGITLQIQSRSLSFTGKQIIDFEVNKILPDSLPLTSRMALACFSVSAPRRA